MAKHCNSIVGFNNTGKIIPAYTSVMVGGRIYASGFDDDICFEISPADSTLRVMPGVTACDIYPKMAGKVIISGIANARIPEYFDPGDRLVPDGRSGWETSDSGSIQVVISADDSGIGAVLIGSGGSAAFPYSGYFSVEDKSTPDGRLAVIIHGGDTDLGYIQAREIKIEKESTQIYLLAEYIRTGTYSGYFKLTLTGDYKNEKVSDEFALWDLAQVTIESDETGKQSLKITQQWQNGAIYWGSRYWI